MKCLFSKLSGQKYKEEIKHLKLPILGNCIIHTQFQFAKNLQVMLK